MLASKSISQSVTKTNHTQQKDSIVILPVNVARQVIIDLEDGDKCCFEVDYLKQNIEEQGKIIVNKDSVIARQNRIILSHEKSQYDYNEIDSLNQATIRNLNLKYTKEVKRKKTWKYIAGFFALVAIIVK